jgi:WD40 repeat protein
MDTSRNEVRVAALRRRVAATACALAWTYTSVAHAQTRTVYARVETGQHAGWIKALDIDQAERHVVTVSLDKTARVWNLQSGKLERILRPPIGEGDEGELYAVAISPDGNRIAVGGVTGSVAAKSFPIYLFDRASGRLTGRSRGYSAVVNRLRFSGDGKRLAAVFGKGMGVRILDATNMNHELLGDDDCTDEGYGADFDGTGRLVTSCDDGILRLYDPLGGRFQRKLGGTNRPYGVQFSPDGKLLAVGFSDTTTVVVLSALDLSLRYEADTRVATNGNLWAVAWGRKDKKLYGAGRLNLEGIPILAWPELGRGAPILLGAGGFTNTVSGLATLTNGGVVVASADPAWGVLGPDGQRERLVLPAVLDHRNNQREFRVSADGQRVEFGFDVWDGVNWSRKLARFDIGSRRLEIDVGQAELPPPRMQGPAIANWFDHTNPTLNGQRLKSLDKDEMSRSLSVAPDLLHFVLGTQSFLRSFDANGNERWVRRVPDIAWAVNQSEDGHFVVVALGDGTIRWYDANTGSERLALFVHSRDRRWVLFTPEGFYQASPGGDTLIGYQVNQGPDREADFVDSAQLSAEFFRPDLITRRMGGDEDAIAYAVRTIGDVRTVLKEDLPPEVTLLSSATAVSDGDYELKVHISPVGPGAKVGGIRLFVNDAEVHSRWVAPIGGGDVSERIELAPGQNKVSLVAMRGDGKVASKEVVAHVTVRSSGAPQVLRVLAVGISQYDDAAFKDGVKFAAQDAAAFAAQLSKGAPGLYSAVDSQVLNLRENTDLAHIERELQALAQRARPADTVVIFFAGHAKAPNGRYHFIPADFIYQGDRTIDQGTLSQALLEANLRDLGAGRRLLILDTCDSGFAAAHGQEQSEQKDGLASLMRNSGRYILAAASQEGRALEDGVQGHGFYTSALLEGLAGKADTNNSGLIKFDALAQYVSERVPDLTAPSGYRQQPIRSAYGSDFTIVRDVGH